MKTRQTAVHRAIAIIGTILLLLTHGHKIAEAESPTSCTESHDHLRDAYAAWEEASKEWSRDVSYTNTVMRNERRVTGWQRTEVAMGQELARAARTTSVEGINLERAVRTYEEDAVPLMSQRAKILYKTVEKVDVESSQYSEKRDQRVLEIEGGGVDRMPVDEHYLQADIILRMKLEKEVRDLTLPSSCKQQVER